MQSVSHTIKIGYILWVNYFTTRLNIAISLPLYTYTNLNIEYILRDIHRLTYDEVWLISVLHEYT